MGKNLFNPLLRYGFQKLGIKTVNNTAPDANGNVTVNADYTHPETHSLDMITETETKKIFTADERTTLAQLVEDMGDIQTILESI